MAEDKLRRRRRGGRLGPRPTARRRGAPRRALPGAPPGVAALLLLLLHTAPLSAQGGGAVLEGVVTSAEDGRPVQGATVLLSGTPLLVVTNERGEYRLRGLSEGAYEVRVVAAGYEAAVRPGVRLARGERRRLDVSLEPAAVELPGIVVTAERAGVRPGESVASVAVVTGQEIHSRSAITVDEALPFAPGVIFNAGQMDIRGATGLARGVGSRVLMLLDGHRVLTGETTEIHFDALPVLDVDRVEIVRGAYSTLYGTNALGGVVNLITTPISDEPETKVRLHYGVYDTPSRFKFTDESLNFQGVDLQHSRAIGPVGARFFVGRKTSDGFRQNGDYSRWLLRTKLVFPRESRTPWEFFAIWGREDHGQFFTWRSPEHPFEVEPEAVGDWLRNDKLQLGATVDPVSSPDVLLRVKPHLVWNSVQNHFHDNEEFHRSTRVGTDLQLSVHSGGRNSLIVGGEASRTWVTSSILGNPRLHDLAFFAQDEVEVSGRLKASAGVRVDYHRAQDSEDELTLSPKVGVVFREGPRLSFRASLSRGYRAPSATEQFVNTAVSGFRVIPNPELRGETAWSGEVGVTAEISDRLWLDGALFQSEFWDLIEPAAVSGELFIFQFQNRERARVRGIDLEGRAGLLPNLLDLRLTYTFLDTKEIRTELPLPYRSAHNLTATAAALEGRVGVDVRYRSPVERVLAFPLDPRDPIALVDFRVGERLLGVDLRLKVSNLFQTEYVDVQERNLGAPRTFLFTVARGL